MVNVPTVCHKFGVEYVDRSPESYSDPLKYLSKSMFPDNPSIEPEKTLNSQSNVEKENQSWWHHNSRLQALIQSCHHQDSMVPAQKQTHRSMEQNRDPRNGLSTLWSTYPWQSRKEFPMEKRQSLQQMVLGKLDSHMQKNETGPFPYTIQKDKLKMNERPQCETEIHQNPREHRQ